MFDIDKVKNKFFMFSNEPTHDIIFNTKGTFLCLVKDDFQIYITGIDVNLSYIKDLSHIVRSFKYKTYEEMISNILRFIKMYDIEDWYNKMLREKKLERIMK
jgi:hypothetical protein